MARQEAATWQLDSAWICAGIAGNRYKRYDSSADPRAASSLLALPAKGCNMGQPVQVCVVLTATLLTAVASGQERRDVDVEELRLEIAHLRASLNELQERLDEIEQRLPPPDTEKDGVTPRLALDGFCPVALVEEMERAQPKWIPGQPELTRTYEGLRYRFSSDESLKAFEKDPHRYALVMQGNDVVIAMRESRRAPGRREYGGRWQGRTYLFANKASYTAFLSSPYEFAAFAQQNSSVAADSSIWAQTWTYLSRYRPIEAWIAGRVFEACSFSTGTVEAK